MELVDYVRILRKRWWIIIVAVVLTVGSAVVFSRLQPAATLQNAGQRVEADRWASSRSRLSANRRCTHPETSVPTSQPALQKAAYSASALT